LYAKKWHRFVFQFLQRNHHLAFSINSSSDSLDGDSDDDDKKQQPKRSENDNENPPPKRPRSSPLTVNPSNSGVIGGRHIKKKKPDDDFVEEIEKLNDAAFLRTKEQERHNKVLEDKVYEECAMYKATDRTKNTRFYK